MVTKEVKYLFPNWNKTREGIYNAYILYSSMDMQGMEEDSLSGSDWYKEFSAVPQISHKMLEMTNRSLVRITAFSWNASQKEKQIWDETTATIIHP